MLLLLGVLGIARVTEPLLGVTAVAREAARAGALADNANDAAQAAWARGQQVASDYGLKNVTIEPDVANFGPTGEVRVTAATSVRLSDVPLLHLSDLQLRRTHAEVVGMWRAVASSGSQD